MKKKVTSILFLLKNLIIIPGHRGFVAWPPNKFSKAQQHADVEISEGRLKGGGYVAYPGNES